MNKKGFTIIELLAVILIVSILLIIAVPTVMKYMKKGTESYYTSLESELKVAGADYVETYRSLLPQNIGHVRVIALDELVTNKYIDPVTDEKGNACTGQVTIKKIKTDSYEYYSCLKCGEYYSSKDEDCSYREDDNVYEDTDRYRIEVTKAFTVNQGESFVPPLAKVYYDNKLVKDDLKGNPDTVDTNKLGVHDVVYYYHGAKEIAKVTVVDNTKPGNTKVVLRYTNASGKSYQGNWFSGNIYVSYKATDYTNSGIKGSGIDHYEVSTDGTNFVAISSENQEYYEKLSDTEQLMKKEGNYTRYVRAVDKSGNIGEKTSYNIKIDKTKPTCTWSGESTDWEPKVTTYPSETARNNFARTIVATCHDSVSSCTSGTTSKTWIEKETNTTKALSYTMVDLAGNTQVCSKTANIYIDKQKPTITATDLPLDTSPYNFASNAKGNLTTTCGPSGCTITCNPQFIFTY